MQRRDAGEVQEVVAGVRGLIAPNPGPMTHWGTNTFLIGTRSIAVIDPGPDDPAHLAAIKRALGGAKISHVLITHAHLDHSPLARRLAVESGAPILAFGDADAGRSLVMRELVEAGLEGGGEGVDTAFSPNMTLGEGDIVETEEWQLEALHTPGHFAGHLAFRMGEHIFSGDHVMDWSSSLVSPPDGDLAAFMTTCRRLRELEGTRFHPAHGGTLDDPAERLGWLIAHRQKREAAILDVLNQSGQKIPDLARTIYTELPTKMLPAAERNVFAHLIDLVERNLVVAVPRLDVSASFHSA